MSKDWDSGPWFGVSRMTLEIPSTSWLTFKTTKSLIVDNLTRFTDLSVQRFIELSSIAVNGDMRTVSRSHCLAVEGTTFSVRLGRTCSFLYVPTKREGKDLLAELSLLAEYPNMHSYKYFTVFEHNWVRKCAVLERENLPASTCELRKLRKKWLNAVQIPHEQKRRLDQEQKLMDQIHALEQQVFAQRIADEVTYDR